MHGSSSSKTRGWVVLWLAPSQKLGKAFACAEWKSELHRGNNYKLPQRGKFLSCYTGQLLRHAADPSRSAETCSAHFACHSSVPQRFACTIYWPAAIQSNNALVKISRRHSQKHIGQDPTQALTEAHWSRSHAGTHRSTLVKIPHRRSQKLIGQDPTQALTEAHWSRSHTGTHRSTLVKIPPRHSQKHIGQDPTQALTEAHWSRSHTGIRRSTLVKIPHRHSQKLIGQDPT